MSDDDLVKCTHGFERAKDCWKCIESTGVRFTTFAKVGREEMAQITRGADWEFKIEGVPTVMPRQRLTLRLTEGEAETLYRYAYMPSTGTLVKYKLRKALHEYFGSFMMDLIDATGLPILILPWGDPIGSWQKELTA